MKCAFQAAGSSSAPELQGCSIGVPKGPSELQRVSSRLGGFCSDDAVLALAAIQTALQSFYPRRRVLVLALVPIGSLEA